MDKLSPHFSLEEFTRSQTATRQNIDNTPDDEQLNNLKRVAYTLEIVRLLLDRPIIISSGFRCLELNKAIGSSDKSWHTKGLAVDFHVNGMIPGVVISQIRDVVGYDQLIDEFEGWVHLGLSLEHRSQVLQFRKVAGKTKRTSI